MSEPIICLEQISKSYGDKTILNQLDLDIFEGEFLGISGVSGAGKSTLMNILLGIDTYDEGHYFLFGEAFENLKYQNNTRINIISMIFQSSNLIKELTVRENIRLPSLYLKNDNSFNQDQFLYVTNLLGINDLLDQNCNTLSGGELQRVAIARCIYYSPKIIIADEPTGNLDEGNTLAVMEILKTLHQENTTIILITHDKSLLSYCTRVLTLEAGVLL